MLDQINHVLDVLVHVTDPLRVGWALFVSLADTRLGWTAIGYISGLATAALIAAYVVADGIYRSEESDQDIRDDYLADYGMAEAPTVVHDFRNGERAAL